MKRFKDVLKDEQGLTLVELLAVVVILAIILGIGAVGIGKVIQNSREDAQLSNVKQVLAAAVLKKSQEVDAAATAWTTQTAADLAAEDLLEGITLAVPADISITEETVGSKKVLQIEAKPDSVKAGTKGNKLFKYDETNIQATKRSNLFD